MTGRTNASATVLWMGGRPVDASTASLRWNDRGVLVGLGVFETIELRDGHPFALRRHLRRLAAGLDSLGLEPPHEDLHSAALAVARSWGLAPGRLRITCTAGADEPDAPDGPRGRTPNVMIAASPGAIRTTSVDVVASTAVRNERGALAGVKTTSYAENMVLLAGAARVGADEVLLANTVGNLCEGATSNVVVEMDGALITPPLSSGCLPGITRELLLETLADAGRPIVERDIAFDDLGRAEAVALISTGRHLQPVSRIDGRPLSTCPGPLTDIAAQLWKAGPGGRQGADIVDL